MKRLTHRPFWHSELSLGARCLLNDVFHYRRLVIGEVFRRERRWVLLVYDIGRGNGKDDDGCGRFFGGELDATSASATDNQEGEHEEHAQKNTCRSPNGSAYLN